MSANNWAICPRCAIKATREKDKLKTRAESEYGKIPISDYLELVKKAEKPIKVEETLRKDYEFYLSLDGEFSATYSCRCECGFEHEFKHSEQLKIG